MAFGDLLVNARWEHTHGKQHAYHGSGYWYMYDIQVLANSCDQNWKILPQFLHTIWHTICHIGRLAPNKTADCMADATR